MKTPDDLERFIDAQAPLFTEALEELSRGKKRSHWMWFVFPQRRGLGHSQASQYFGIASRAEAEAYLRHPVLGARLRQCTALVLAIEGKRARAIFGTPDDLKFRSSMTLFAAVAPEEPLFQRALKKYYNDEPDPKTLELLREEEYASHTPRQ